MSECKTDPAGAVFEVVRKACVRIGFIVLQAEDFESLGSLQRVLSVTIANMRVPDTRKY